MDTGRRPAEIAALAFDCLTRDSDGSPVMIYDNHKNARDGRRLPVSETTATVIIRQQQRVRERFPAASPGALALLPTVIPVTPRGHGMPPSTESLIQRHHQLGSAACRRSPSPTAASSTRPRSCPTATGIPTPSGTLMPGSLPTCSAT